MTEAVWLIVGFVLGAGVVLVVTTLRSRREQERVQQLLDESQRAKADEMSATVEQLKTIFSSLSREALSANTDDFLKLAKTRLDQQTTAGSEQLESKKKLIDASLTAMDKKLGDLTQLTQSLDKERRESVGAIKTELVKAAETTTKLTETTSQLREALAHPQARGQWGERMAEDVLRLAGFVEGINYEKQTMERSGGKPDFTFMLPQGLRLNMDVKFPLDNYLRTIEAPDDAAAEPFKKQFLRDVRTQVKAVTTREYIDTSRGTVDCVVIFIPNERIYTFIHEHDRALLDDAARQKVVLSSPLTLYAVLTVVRQAVDNFRLSQTSNEILNLLSEFRRQWGKYGDVVDKVERALKTMNTAFDELKTTRTRQLDRQLDKIDDLQADAEQSIGDESSDTPRLTA